MFFATTLGETAAICANEMGQRLAFTKCGLALGLGLGKLFRRAAAPAAIGGLGMAGALGTRQAIRNWTGADQPAPELPRPQQELQIDPITDPPVPFGSETRWWEARPLRQTYPSEARREARHAKWNQEFAARRKALADESYKQWKVRQAEQQIENERLAYRPLEQLDPEAAEALHRTEKYRFTLGRRRGRLEQMYNTAQDVIYPRRAHGHLVRALAGGPKVFEKGKELTDEELTARLEEINRQIRETSEGPRMVDEMARRAGIPIPGQHIGIDASGFNPFWAPRDVLDRLEPYAASRRATDPWQDYYQQARNLYPAMATEEIYRKHPEAQSWREFILRLARGLPDIPYPGLDENVPPHLEPSLRSR